MSQAIFDIQLFPSKLDRRNNINSDKEIYLSQIRFDNPQKKSVNKKPKKPKAYLKNEAYTPVKSQSKQQQQQQQVTLPGNEDIDTTQANLIQGNKRKVNFVPDDDLVTVIDIESYKRFNAEHTSRNVDLTPIKCNCILV